MLVPDDIHFVKQAKESKTFQYFECQFLFTYIYLKRPIIKYKDQCLFLTAPLTPSTMKLVIGVSIALLVFGTLVEGKTEYIFFTYKYDTFIASQQSQPSSSSAASSWS